MRIQSKLYTGTRFELSGVNFEITFIHRGEISYASTTGGKQYRMTVDRFFSLVDEKKIICHEIAKEGQISLLDAPKHIRRKRYVDAALNELQYGGSQHRLEPIIATVSEELNDAKPPHPSTVAKWIKLHRDSSGIISSFSKNQGNRSTRYAAEVELLIHEAITEVYLVTEHREAQDVLAYIVGKLYERDHLSRHSSNYVIPNIRTIQRRLKSLDPYLIASVKDGNAIARRQARASGRKLISAGLMHTVEIDTHYIDLMIIDRSTGREIGKPYLTLIIEVKTRVIVGLHVSTFPPSTITALAALKDMLTRPNRGLRGGICSIIIPDNGIEFVNAGFENVCATLLITILSSQVREPNGKPHIESHFSTLTTSLIHKLEGTTFSNPKQRGDYKSSAKAVFDLETATSFINEWIENIYHKRIHSQTKRMPIELWDELCKDVRINHLSDKEAEALIRRPIGGKKINQGRVRYDNITYFSHALRTLENSGLKHVTILVNDLDLNEVLIPHPTDRGALISALSNEPDYTTHLTRYEHEKTQEIKKSFSQADTEKYGKYANLIAHYQLMQRIHDESIKSKKQLKKLTQGKPQLSYADSKIQEIISILNKEATLPTIKEATTIELEVQRIDPPKKIISPKESKIKFSSFLLEKRNDKS
jgi:putative transposase